jgi:hypothetical protein
MIKDKDKLKEYQRKYREENKEKIASYYKNYNAANKDKNNTYIKSYNESNKDKRKEYNASNRERRNKQMNKWYSDNKESVQTYRRNRRNLDPLYKLRNNIRGLIRISIKRQGYSKKSKTYEILGCSFDEFKSHIEKQFMPGMTWDNYGDWEYDHIKPISNSINEIETIQLNHYSNFQPLWWEENTKKGNKLDYGK